LGKVAGEAGKSGKGDQFAHFRGRYQLSDQRRFHYFGGIGKVD
jgi:hypothetical protein